RDSLRPNRALTEPQMPSLKRANLISLQTLRSEDVSDQVHLGRKRRREVFQLVVQLQFLPFKLPQLMKGKNIDSLNVAQAGGKHGELVDIPRFLVQPRHAHKPR